jgi:hypothetical protein
VATKNTTPGTKLAAFFRKQGNFGNIFSTDIIVVVKLIGGVVTTVEFS